MKMPDDLKERWDKVVSAPEFDDDDPVGSIERVCEESDFYLNELFDPHGWLYDEVTELLPSSTCDSLCQDFVEVLWSFVNDPNFELCEYELSQLKSIESGYQRPGGFGELAANILSSNPNLPEDWLLAAGRYLLYGRYHRESPYEELSKFLDASEMTPAIALQLMNDDDWDRFDFDTVCLFLRYVHENTLALADDDPLIIGCNDILHRHYITYSDPEIGLESLHHIWTQMYPSYSRMSPDDITLCADMIEAQDCDTYVLQTLAEMLVSQRCCPTEVLERILDWEDCDDAHKVIAQNPNLPPWLCETLARSENDLLRAQIAEHPNLPTHIIDQLAHDASASVRRGVASSPKATSTLLDELAVDESPGVRETVAVNPNTSTSTLTLLTGDTANDVAVAAKRMFAERSTSTLAWTMSM